MSGLFPRDLLDEIAERLDIVAIISEHVPLKKSGKDYKGCCPFHQEKTPSFMVSPTKRIFHCFGCSEGGNVFGFLMKIDKLTFPEAVRKLADRAGVSLEEKGVSRGPDRSVYYRINKYVAWYFAENLKRAPQGIAARYLEKRGLTPETVEIFQLGYAPDGWQGLVDFLEEKRVPLTQAAELGLIRPRKEGNGYYDLFRNRLMFPIIDDEGRVAGFGGRRLSDADANEAKYINSPESPVYHKGHGVYGLFQSKKAARESGELILVEGYLDLIRLYQTGIRNVVAPLGTALTLAQVKHLARFAEKFVVMFDGDSAGLKALLRSVPIFVEAGFHPRVLPLPQGEDPDTYVAKVGASVLRQKMADAQPAMDWILITHLAGTGLSPAKRVEAAKLVLPYIEALPQGLERQSYLARLSQYLGGVEMAPGKSQDSKKFSSRIPATKSAPDPKISLERKMIRLYVRQPQNLKDILNKEVFLQFEDDELKAAGLSLEDEFCATGKIDLEKWLTPGGPFDAGWLAGLMFDGTGDIPEDEARKLAADLLQEFRKRKIKSELKALTGEIQIAEMKQDHEAVKNLLQRKSEILRPTINPSFGNKP